MYTLLQRFHILYRQVHPQIKTADQVIFADPEVSRVTSLILKNGGSHVRLEGIDIKNINTQVLNEGYNKESLLSR